MKVSVCVYIYVLYVYICVCYCTYLCQHYNHYHHYHYDIGFADVWGEAIDLENEAFSVDDNMGTPRSTSQTCVVGHNGGYRGAGDVSERFIIGEESTTGKSLLSTDSIHFIIH